jgi:hypothetical protein
MAHAPKNERLPAPADASARVASKPSQSLGKWIDNLLGDKKAREKAAIKAAERRKFFPQQ